MDEHEMNLDKHKEEQNEKENTGYYFRMFHDV